MLSALTVVRLFLTKFISNNWKWLLPLIAAIFVFLWVKNHYYDQGRAEERIEWQARLEREEVKNRKLSELLQTSVQSFAEIKQRQDNERVSREIIRENRISTIVEDRPVYQQCLIDQEVLDEQNALKELGPRP